MTAMTTSIETESTRVDYETLYTEVSGGIAVLTINRPEVRNAVNRRWTPSGPTTRYRW